MIATKSRESRRSKLKNARLFERLYKEAKCRDCSVVVTKMDFAKILGKFTKVKIQYESSSPKSKRHAEISSSKPNARLKNNENGMVQIHRSVNNKQPVKNALNQKKLKLNDNSTLSLRNVLKENNVLQRNSTPKVAKTFSSNLKNIRKQYAIIFNEPINNKNNDIKNELCLSDLLPHLNINILPSEEWCIDYFPKAEEPKVDKVYDRIAAELEDLMNSDKPLQKKPETKVDEFPSIMDILNDNTPTNNVDVKDQNNSLEFKSNLDSSDVEAMLLGKPNSSDHVKESESMDIDNSYVDKLIDSEQQITEEVKSKKEEEKVSGPDPPSETNEIENPGSPSILDEALQKGIEEHLPADQSQAETTSEVSSIPKEEDSIVDKVQTDAPLIDTKQNETQKNPEEISDSNTNIFPLTHIDSIKYVTFKKFVDGKCSKAVTCPKNLKFSIELDSKVVEFLGAPKYISSVDDLQVLLQIVNESNLQSLYVLY